MSRFSPGDRVKVLGMNDRLKYTGRVAEDLGGADVVRVVPDGKAKPRSVQSSKVRHLDRPRPVPPRVERPPNTATPPFRAQPKPQGPIRDAEYLAFVREHPCCTPGCDRKADDAHHTARRGRNGGMAQKPDDLRTVPVCRACHDYFHGSEGAGRLPGLETKAMTMFWLFSTKEDLLVEYVQQLKADLVALRRAG